MSEIRAIITDLGGVLVRFDHRIASRAFALLSGKPEQDVHALLYGSEHGYDRGTVSSAEFHLWAAHRLGLSTSFEAFRKVWSDIFAPDPGVHDLFSRLKGRYPIVLLSNTNEMHFRHLVEGFSVLGLPDRFVLSYELGCAKPDPHIYRAAVQASGCPPEECVYIDDIPAYVEAASCQGLRGVWFHGVEALREELRSLGVSP